MCGQSHRCRDLAYNPEHRNDFCIQLCRKLPCSLNQMDSLVNRVQRASKDTSLLAADHNHSTLLSQLFDPFHRSLMIADRLIVGKQPIS